MIPLAVPNLTGREKEYLNNCIDTTYVSSVGEYVTRLEKMTADVTENNYAVATSSGTTGLHITLLASGVKAEELVIVPAFTFIASANAVAHCGAIPWIMDIRNMDWCLDPDLVRSELEQNCVVQEGKLIHKADGRRVAAIMPVYTLGNIPNMQKFQAMAKEYGIPLIVDAACAIGALYNGEPFGKLADVSVISFNGNKTITSGGGGMVVGNDKELIDRIRHLTTTARVGIEYDFDMVGYNYRMSNIVAGIARGNMLHIAEHIEAKKQIYERYKDGFRDLPVSVNPYDKEKSIPNYWLSCLLIEKEAMCKQVRGEKEALYISEGGKSCPTEILEKLAENNAEGRPIWKPMHMQPLYRNCPFITAKSNNTYSRDSVLDVGADIYERGLCLPSDNKMMKQDQDRIIEIVKSCFG